MTTEFMAWASATSELDSSLMSEGHSIACPQCRRTMVPGQLHVSGGRSWLYFFAAQSRKGPRLDLERDAFRCDSCGTTLLLGTMPEELSCFECGTIIETAASACAKCGWTW